MTTQITYTMQRYAAEIYRLQEHHEYVSLSALAEEVDASLQAISRMLGRLKNAGLIEREPYHGVRLTRLGEQMAMPAIRRHRLSELFLVRVLGFGWHEVHALTDQFELGVDQAIEDKIFAVCGQPTRCPHGEPIPSRDGIMPVVTDSSLVNLPAGQEYCISRVRIHDPRKLSYLGEMGLLPDKTFRLQSIAPFQGPVRIQFNSQEIILSYELAAGLFVTP